MTLLLQALLGTLLGAGFLAFARRRPGLSERRIAAAGLVIAALVYVAFVLFAEYTSLSSTGGIRRELVGLVLFGIVAWLGGSGRLSPRVSIIVLATGWAAHTLWDLVAHGRPPAWYVPTWYPGVCLGFDLVVAFGIFSRLGTIESDER